MAYNPTGSDIQTDFSGVKEMSEQLTVALFSENYNATNVFEK